MACTKRAVQREAHDPGVAPVGDPQVPAAVDGHVLGPEQAPRPLPVLPKVAIFSPGGCTWRSCWPRTRRRTGCRHPPPTTSYGRSNPGRPPRRTSRRRKFASKWRTSLEPKATSQNVPSGRGLTLVGRRKDSRPSACRPARRRRPRSTFPRARAPRPRRRVSTSIQSRTRALPLPGVQDLLPGPQGLLLVAGLPLGAAEPDLGEGVRWLVADRLLEGDPGVVEETAVKGLDTGAKLLGGTDGVEIDCLGGKQRGQRTGGRRTAFAVSRSQYRKIRRTYLPCASCPCRA